MTSKNMAGGAVRVKDATNTKKKNPDGMGAQAKVKLTAPELPGSMKYMLGDDKGEDSGLHAIRVTFYPRNVTQIEFLVTGAKGQREYMGPSEYDSYKETLRAVNKEKRESEAAAGWVKKLSLRCLVFAKPEDPVSAIAMMSTTPVPEVVRGMMSYSQAELTAKFPNPGAVLQFWSNQADATLKGVQEYAAKFGVDFMHDLALLKGAQDERDQRKAEKSARAVTAKGKTSESAAQTQGTTPALKPPIKATLSASVRKPTLEEAALALQSMIEEARATVKFAAMQTLSAHLGGKEEALKLIELIEDHSTSTGTKWNIKQFQQILEGKVPDGVTWGAEEEELSAKGAPGEAPAAGKI